MHMCVYYLGTCTTAASQQSLARVGLQAAAAAAAAQQRAAQQQEPDDDDADDAMTKKIHMYAVGPGPHISL